MLGNSFATGMYNRKTLGKVYSCYFLETILQRFWYYMGAHSLGTQMEGLHKLAAVAKRKLFVSYENWQRGRQMVLSHFFYVFISHSANEGIYMDSMQKSGQK